MRLDSKIKDTSKIIMCNELEKAESYIGKRCYFGETLEDFIKLKKEFLGILVDIDKDDNEAPFEAHLKNLDVVPYFSYFIPCEFIDGKSLELYRPYKLVSELPFKVGNSIYLKEKNSNIEIDCVCTSVMSEGDEIRLISFGTKSYSTQELFENYNWKSCLLYDFEPLGIKV